MTVFAALVLLDRLLLAAEARGWVYYRRIKPSRGAASSALLQIFSIYEPGHERVVEQRSTIDVDAAADDEPR